MAAFARKNTVATDLEAPLMSLGQQAQDHPGEHLQVLLDGLREDDWQSQQSAQFDESQSLKR